MASTISVSACDNELILVAFTFNASFELCRIQSGNNNPVDVRLDVTAGPYINSIVMNGLSGPLVVNDTQTIPSGSYQLLVFGINWGGPAQFTIYVDGNPHLMPLGPASSGLVLNNLDTITI
jgi:hypothetical protein